MFYRIFSYIKFLLRSTNQHGVHSPFVYNFVTKCLYNKKAFNAYKSIMQFRKKAAKSNIKTVKTTPLKEAKLLFRIVNYFQFKNILELGTLNGVTTHAIHLGNSDAKITTIEKNATVSAFVKNVFRQFNITNIKVLTGGFSENIKPLVLNKYNLIYFNINNNKDAVLDCFDALLPTATNDSVFIFDAIYCSKNNTEAWEVIKNNPKVKVTVDTFFCGIVFFRKEQAKEHFTIRV